MLPPCAGNVPCEKSEQKSDKHDLRIIVRLAANCNIFLGYKSRESARTVSSWFQGAGIIYGLQSAQERRTSSLQT
jgi:hypothetical protein